MNIKHAFKQCARALGNDDWCEQLDRHFVALKRRGPRLVVTFDNMTSRDAHGPRNPWGWNIVESLGHSHLGVCMSRRNDWFRHPDLFDLFDRLRDQGFFEQFEDVVFYGSSMGGYGALSFAQAAPGARVVAFVPQTTLCPDLAPFEQRFLNGRERGDYKDRRYVDGAVGAGTARSVAVFYDPYHAPDRAQVERLPADNLQLFRAPFFGHKVPRLLHMMGSIRELTVAALNDELTAEKWKAAMAGRYQTPGYIRILLNAALEQGHHSLVSRALPRAEAHLTRPLPKYRRLVAIP